MSSHKVKLHKRGGKTVVREHSRKGKNGVKSHYTESSDEERSETPEYPNTGNAKTDVAIAMKLARQTPTSADLKTTTKKLAKFRGNRVVPKM